MKDNTDWNVYVLTAPNGKIYVGVTRRLPRKRWQYGHGYERNEEFYSDIRRFGWKSIKREIVSTFNNADEAYALEKALIQRYNSTDPKYGYNKSTGGAGSEGVKISEKTRAKLVASHLGKKLPHNDQWDRNIQTALKKRYETHPKPIPPSREKSVLQYTKELAFVREYPSAREAERQTSVRGSNISKCCRGTAKTAGGYIWKFKNEKE